MIAIIFKLLLFFVGGGGGVAGRQHILDDAVPFISTKIIQQLLLSVSLSMFIICVSEKYKSICA